MTIRQKQWQLWLLGYYDLAIDGVWGKMSESGTEAFQAAEGLEADGIFGVLTEAQSRRVITNLQKALNTVRDTVIAVDGLAGMETASAISKWQIAQGETATGRANPDTYARLIAAANLDEDADWWSQIKHFARAEFACPCSACGGFPVEPERTLVETADAVREHFGDAAILSSGVRCAAHNPAVGGVPGSRHLTGKAMDFRVEGVRGNKLLAHVKTYPTIRYAYRIDGGDYVHMDVY